MGTSLPQYYTKYKTFSIQLLKFYWTNRKGRSDAESSEDTDGTSEANEIGAFKIAKTDMELQGTLFNAFAGNRVLCYLQIRPDVRRHHCV